jgi:uncharacterized damage-inducible protein DinB
MPPILSDLYGHQAWADAEHWRVLALIDAALDDPAIRKRLHHIHLVQHSFLSIVTGSQLRRRKLEEFETMDDLKAYAREYHVSVRAYLSSVSDLQLVAQVNIPWFRQPRLELTVEQALYQAALHSHYHRGQNAIRMRELGGDPPLTDLIAWYWKGKPEACWNPKESRE